MKIAAVNQDPGIAPGRAKGAAVHLEAMRAAFRALGHEVVAFDQPTPELLGTQLASSAHQRPFDLIYERYALGATAASHFAEGRGIPHVVEVNAPLIEEAAAYRGLSEAQAQIESERRIFEHASLLSAVSADVAAYCRARSARHAPVAVHPNGIDTEWFHPGRRQGARERTNIPSSRFVLGFHGRLRPWHEFETLARATVALVSEGIDAHLLCVGNGDFLETAREATDGVLDARRLTVCTWLPYEEVGGWIGAFDCLPLTYAASGPHYFSPLKLREAMAVGAVPVVPRVGDLESAVQHGENGLVYAAGDTPSLVAHLVTLARDPSYRQRLAGTAVASAQRHTWQHNARAILTALGLPVEVRVASKDVLQTGAQAG